MNGAPVFDVMWILLPPALALVGLHLRQTFIERTLLWSLFATVGLLGLSLAWCFPSQDDWCYAASVKTGWFAAQMEWYTNWSGRIAATALISSWGLIGDPLTAAAYGYRIVLAGLWLALAVALWDVSRAIMLQAPAKHQLRFACLVLVGWFCALPTVNECMYWLAGAATYLGGSTCALALAATVIHAQRGVQWRWRLALPIAAITPLFSEVVAVMTIALLTIATVYASGRDRWRMVAIWLTALLSLCVIALAPGNLHRAATAVAQGESIPNHEPLIMIGTLVEMVRSLFGDIEWAVPILLAGWLAAISPPGDRKLGVACLSAIWIALIAAFATMAWAGMAPARAWNPPTMLIVMGLLIVAVRSFGQQRWFIWSCFASAAGSIAWQSWSEPESLVLLILAWLAVILCAWIPAHYRREHLSCASVGAILAVSLLLANPRVWQLATSATWSGPLYANQQFARLRTLSTAEPGSSVRVPVLDDPRPHFIYHDDFGFSPTTWQNTAAANFFGLKDVRSVIVNRSALFPDLPPNAEANSESSPSPQR